MGHIKIDYNKFFISLFLILVMAKDNNKGKGKRLVTAALPYINNVPHLGHIVGSHLPADIFARFCRLKGYDTLFIGGTDENGSTSELAAESVGIDIGEFSDKLYREHKKVYEWFNFSYDNFSRTSKPIHHKTTKDIFKGIYDNGYITKGEMKVFYSPKEDKFLPDRYVKGECPECGYKDANGDQCENCTAVLDANKLINPKSTITGNSVEARKAKHLFLRLDKLEDNIGKWVKKQERWTSQTKGIAEGWLEEGLKKRCITRDLEHGVRVPLDEFKDKVLYVWFDAPIGYVSSTKELTEKWKEFWKNKNSDIFHFLGKDNIPFHTIFWPGILIGFNKNRNEEEKFNLPSHVAGYQYLNYEGGKFSKSKNRGIFCEKLPESDMDPDELRAYLTFVIPEKSDTEFRWEDFKRRMNTEIIGNFSNFINRCMGFINNKLDGEILKPKELGKEEKELRDKIKKSVKDYEDYLENVEIRNAFKEILYLSGQGNQYFDKLKPWEKVKEDKEGTKETLFVFASLCKDLAIMINPFLPGTSQKIWDQLNLEGTLEEGMFEEATKFIDEDEHEVNESNILFEKITGEYIEKLKKQFSDNKQLEEFFGKEKKEHSKIEKDGDKIGFEDWQKLDLRVAKITEVENIEKSDKLYKLKVDIGTGQRQLVAGLKNHYKEGDLEGKRCVVFCNLESAELMGVKSEGMVLAASDEEKSNVRLLEPDEKIEEGSKIE